MPYEVKKSGDQYCVYKQGTKKKLGCHATRKEADDQMAALYAKEKAELETRFDKQKAEG